MLDLQLIREDPQGVKKAMQSLGAEAPIDEILALDEKRRDLLQDVEGLRHERNVTSKKIGQMK
ncbi:MAG: serine--tRNA ligase, partial [Anaerolineales bacterium]